MLGSDSALAASAESHSASWPLQDDVEVHAENTGEGVVLDSQIDVLLDSEAEVAGVREVLLLEFTVLNLQSSLEDFVGLLSADGHVHGNLLVSLDAETSDGEAGSRGDGLLACEILQHFAGCVKLMEYPW